MADEEVAHEKRETQEEATQEVHPDAETAASPTEDEAAPKPSKEAAKSLSKVEAAPASSKVEAAAKTSRIEAAPRPSKVEAAKRPSQVEAAPRSSKVEAAPRPSQVEAAPRPSKVEAAPRPSQAESTQRPSQVKAAPRSSQAEATPRPSKAEATPTPSKVEASPTPSTSEATPTPTKAEAASPPSKTEAGAEVSRDVEPPPAEKLERRRSRSKLSTAAGSRLIVVGQKGDRKQTASKLSLTSAKGDHKRNASKLSVTSARESLFRLRQPSKWLWQRSGSFISFRRSSLGMDKMKALYENTYALEPNEPFSTDRVKLLLRNLLEGDEISYPEKYEPESALKLANEVAFMLRTCVKELAYDRYRLVCTCEVVENRGQTAAHGLRFLWDAERDRFASFTIEKSTYYVISTIFGIYAD